MPRVSIAVPQLNREIISRVIEKEGGFVDDPSDSGGATKYGITQATLCLWERRQVYRNDVKNLTIPIAIQIYYQDYWIPANLNNIGNYPIVKEFMFDWIIHSGFKTPIKHLQTLVDVDNIDGILGSVTEDAINLFFSNYGEARFPEAFGELIDVRILYYINLVQRRHKDIKFIEGWFIRANSFRLYGLNDRSVTVT